MPSDVIEPPVGSSTPSDETARPEASPAPSTPPPRTSRANSSSSGDELTAFLTEGRPDPMLGSFVDAPPGDEARSAGSYDALTGIVTTPPSTPTTPSALDPIGSLGLPGGRGLLESTNDSVEMPLPSSQVDDEDDAPARGVSWTTLLLASYASAVTIGLFWVLTSGRRLSDFGAAEVPLFDSRPDPGRRADRSKRLVDTGRQEPSHLAALGQTVQLGVVEVTPVSVGSGRVVLERTLGQNARKDGGKGALRLKLRVKNVSKDVLLAPLDEAFIREREPGMPDSYIDLGPSQPIVEMYPLAVESEWSIVGQEFRDLKPGETFETTVVSAPDAAALATAPQMTWRIRLRSDINHTDELGIRFQANQIKAEP